MRKNTTTFKTIRGNVSMKIIKKCSPLLTAAIHEEIQFNFKKKKIAMSIISRLKQWTTSKKTRALARKSLVIFLLSVVLTEPAYAGTGIPTVDTVIQFIVDVLTGSLARLIAILTCINIGYKCKMNEMSVQKGAAEVGGIGIVMGSAYIVDAWGIF